MKPKPNRLAPRPFSALPRLRVAFPPAPICPGMPLLFAVWQNEPTASELQEEKQMQNEPTRVENRG